MKKMKYRFWASMKCFVLISIIGVSTTQIGIAANDNRQNIHGAKIKNHVENAENPEKQTAVSGKKISSDEHSRAMTIDGPELEDPFTLRIPDEESGGFVPAVDASIPSGIKIVSILFVRGQKPLAVIEIPGSSSEDFHFVREEDVIEIDAAIARSALSAKASKPSKNQKPQTANKSQEQQVNNSEPTYIKIVKISKNEVELAPLARPQDARILR